MQIARWFEKNGPAIKFWNSPRVGVPLWLAAAYLCLWRWYWFIPAPGKAIGALAVVAGIMSVRDVNVLGKITWVVLLVCLLVTEFRAIDHDRAEAARQALLDRASQDTAFSSIRDQQNKDFSDTAQGLKDAYDLSKRQFDATIGRVNGVLRTTQQVAVVSKQNLLATTGGSSFAYVLPQNFRQSGPRVSSGLINAGNHVLTGIEVRISRVVRECKPDSKGMCLTMLDDGPMHPIPMANLGPKAGVQMPGTMNTKANQDGTAHYEIQITAQNGSALEQLWFEPAKDGMGSAYRLFVTREVGPISKQGRVKIKKVLQIDWTQPVDVPKLP